jgi:hypothetical protein
MFVTYELCCTFLIILLWIRSYMWLPLITYRLLETIDCIYYLLLKFTCKKVSVSFQCFVSLLVFSNTLMLTNTVSTLPMPNFPLSCEFEPRSWLGVLDTALCDKVCQWQIGGFLRVLRFPPPTQLTATI